MLQLHLTDQQFNCLCYKGASDIRDFTVYCLETIRNIFEQKWNGNCYNFNSNRIINAAMKQTLNWNAKTNHHIQTTYQLFSHKYTIASKNMKHEMTQTKCKTFKHFESSTSEMAWNRKHKPLFIIQLTFWKEQTTSSELVHRNIKSMNGSLTRCLLGRVSAILNVHIRTHFSDWYLEYDYINGLVWKRHNSIVDALELCLFCINSLAPGRFQFNFR